MGKFVPPEMEIVNMMTSGKIIGNFISNQVASNRERTERRDTVERGAEPRADGTSRLPESSPASFDVFFDVL